MVYSNVSTASPDALGEADKYYGVRRGKTVNSCIFLFWGDCKDQVEDVVGADWNSFDDLYAAANFAATPSAPSFAVTPSETNFASNSPSVSNYATSSTAAAFAATDVCGQDFGRTNAEESAPAVIFAAQDACGQDFARTDVEEPPPAMAAADLFDLAANYIGDANVSTIPTIDEVNHATLEYQNNAPSDVATDAPTDGIKYGKLEYSNNAPSDVATHIDTPADTKFVSISLDAETFERQPTSPFIKGEKPATPFSKKGETFSAKKSSTKEKGLKALEHANGNSVLKKNYRLSQEYFEWCAVIERTNNKQRTQKSRVSENLGKQTERKRKNKPVNAEYEEKLSQNWEKKYAEFKRYVEETGDCKLSEGNPLSSWVSHQRLEYRNLGEGKPSRMTAAKIQKLSTLGIIFTEAKRERFTWEDRYELLKEFLRIHGHVNVSRTDPLLGEYVHNQRTSYANYTKGLGKKYTRGLDERRISKLAELGFVFQAGKSKGPTDRSKIKSWEERFEEVLEFKNNFGHMRVPQNYKENTALSHWVETQRKEYKKMKDGRRSSMTPEKALRLYQADFFSKFKPKKEKIRSDEKKKAARAKIKTWEERFEQLLQFKSEKGHMRVPQNYTENPALGNWVHKQRTEYKKMNEGRSSQVTEEKGAKLFEAGLFDAENMPKKGKKLEDQLKILADGQPDSSVPVSAKEEISAALKETSWEERFEQLLQFKSKKGHARVPQNYKENSALGSWVSKQRKEYKKMKDGKNTLMTQERAFKLFQIDFFETLQKEVKKMDQQKNSGTPEIKVSPATAVAPTQANTQGVKRKRGRPPKASKLTAPNAASKEDKPHKTPKSAASMTKSSLKTPAPRRGRPPKVLKTAAAAAALSSTNTSALAASAGTNTAATAFHHLASATASKTNPFNIPIGAVKTSIAAGDNSSRSYMTLPDPAAVAARVAFSPPPSTTPWITGPAIPPLSNTIGASPAMSGPGTFTIPAAYVAKPGDGLQDI